jgi:hypothetical protein
LEIAAEMTEIETGKGPEALDRLLRKIARFTRRCKRF